MTIKTERLGPGTMTLGSDPIAGLSSQVRKMSVVWSESVNTREPLPVLSGEEIPEASTATYAATLQGTFLQDLSLDGVIAWSWAQKGIEHPFEFIPSTAGGRTITGILVPSPLTVGGDVDPQAKEEPLASDFTWRIIGDPSLDSVA